MRTALSWRRCSECRFGLPRDAEGVVSSAIVELAGDVDDVDPVASGGAAAPCTADHLLFIQSLIRMLPPGLLDYACIGLVDMHSVDTLTVWQ
jgi:hypothetical protein